MKPLHRDDVPMEVAEDIVKHLEAKHPGFKVVLAGDAPAGSLPPELDDLMRQLEAQMRDSLERGKCFDCGAQMPNYEPTRDGWEPAEGWTYYTQGEEIVQWVCPACDGGESE